MLTNLSCNQQLMQNASLFARFFVRKTVIVYSRIANREASEVGRGHCLDRKASTDFVVPIADCAALPVVLLFTCFTCKAVSEDDSQVAYRDNSLHEIVKQRLIHVDMIFHFVCDGFVAVIFQEV